MNRISDEQLDRTIVICDKDAARAANVSPMGGRYFGAIVDALRELRDYRKAVREYLEAVDAMRAVGAETGFETLIPRLYFAAEVAAAALRALAQPEEKP